jgi:hypothetical protein
VLKTVKRALEKFPHEDDTAAIAVLALVEHGGKDQLSLAETTALKIDPKERAFSTAIDTITRHLPPGDPALARIAKAGLAKGDGGVGREKLWVAAAKAGGAEMLELIKAQNLEGAQELHSLVVDLINLKMEPIGDPKKHIDAWAGLIERDVKLGWATEILYANYEKVATVNPRYARVAFHKTIDPKYGIEALEFLVRIGGEITDGERAKVDAHRKETAVSE